MDIIFLIIIAPIAVICSFCYYKLQQFRKDWANLPEAKPYQFERDHVIDSFNERLLHQRKQIKKLYKTK